MGIDYTPLLYVGKEFEDSREAEEFLRDNIGFIDEEEREIDEDGLSEFLYNDNRFNLDGDILNYYTDFGGFVLGVELKPRPVDTFAKRVEEAFATWNNLFPKHPADVIHTVKVH